MRRILKNHFIPHEGNDYQPFLLRFKSTLLILGMLVILEGVYLFSTLFVLPRSQNFAAVFAAVLIEQTNEERTTEELGVLRYNAKLELAAKLKAEDMAAKGYFAHNTPDGKTPWYWFKQAGYEYAAAGENLAVNFTDSKDITEAWMRSPTHRANIMSGNYTEIGIATAEGTYKGKSAIFVVQEFGRPSLVARQIEVATSSATALSGLITGSVAGVADVTPAKVAIANTPTPPSPLPVLSQIPPSEDRVSVVPTTTTVAGEDTQLLDIEEPVFTEIVSETVVPSKPSKLDTLIASPRQSTTTIFFIIAAILSLALGLAVFIKIRIQYPHIIANGVLLLAIISAMVMLNIALEFTRGAI